MQAGDELLLDVDPQFWTSPAVNSTFEDIRKGGQVKGHSEFMLPMKVTKFLNGTSIQKAGLRQLPNAFLASIERRGKTLHAVSPDELLETDDIVWFATGSIEAVRFIRNTPGLVPLGEKYAEKLKNTQRVERRLVQAILGPESPLVGTTARDIKFREQFNAAIVAVARHGERIRANPGTITLKIGDILLLDAGPGFASQYKDSKYFSIVIEAENTNPPRYFHTGVCIALVATAFVLYALEELDILVGAGIAVIALLLTGCLSGDQARRAIRWVCFFVNCCSVWMFYLFYLNLLILFYLKQRI